MIPSCGLFDRFQNILAIESNVPKKASDGSKHSDQNVFLFKFYVGFFVFIMYFCYGVENSLNALAVQSIDTFAEIFPY